MKLLDDARLYSRTDECLEFLRQLRRPCRPPGGRERFHLYWHGRWTSKQAFTVKSFLATQDLATAELWLWLDGEPGEISARNDPLLRPLLPFVQLRQFVAPAEARATPLEDLPGLYHRVGLPARSDFVRSVVLYKYGGVYADMDTMFLRDMRILLDEPSLGGEFCYRWSAHLPYANSAFLRLRQGSPTAQALLEICRLRRSCHPRRVLHFEQSRHLDLLVLPCPFFDPLWPQVDGQDRCSAAPFNTFGDFFRTFDDQFPRNPSIRSYRDFFPGAFAYHWHNCWDAPEHADSYFGLFDREFDALLHERLGIELPKT